MNRSTTTPSNTVPADEDLALQAHPGHGVPSQDPAFTAQFPLQPEEVEREANSALMGGAAASDIEQRAEYEKNWASVLDGLAKASMHEALT